MSDEMDNVEWLRKSSSDEWCASALNKCADEIERLREENAQLKDRLVHVSGLAAVYRSEDFNLRKERDAMREENARLREALKPFAEAAEELDEKDKDNWNIWEHWITYVIEIGHLRAAAAAIRKGGKDE